MATAKMLNSKREKPQTSHDVMPADTGGVTEHLHEDWSSCAAGMSVHVQAPEGTEECHEAKRRLSGGRVEPDVR